MAFLQALKPPQSTLDAYKSASEISEILLLSKQTQFISQAHRNSIETSIQLYEQEKYAESLQVIYPTIEGIINTMLTEAEEEGKFNGLTEKVKRLTHRGIIPHDVAPLAEIITGRNKISHGNISPDKEFGAPLCLLVFRYLKMLLTEYRPNRRPRRGRRGGGI